MMTGALRRYIFTDVIYLFIMRTGGRDKFSIKTVPDEISEGQWLEAYDGLLDALGRKHQPRGGLLMIRDIGRWVIQYMPLI